MVSPLWPDEEGIFMSRQRLTNEDKIDNLLCSVSLEEAESMLARAQIVLKVRRKAEEIKTLAQEAKANQVALPMERGAK